MGECTGNEWDYCESEKMGCNGCFYKKLKKNKDKKYMLVFSSYESLNNWYIELVNIFESLKIPNINIGTKKNVYIRINKTTLLFEMRDTYEKKLNGNKIDQIYLNVDFDLVNCYEKYGDVDIVISDILKGRILWTKNQS